MRLKLSYVDNGNSYIDKMKSLYQTVMRLRLSLVNNGNSYNGKMKSLYWESCWQLHIVSMA